MHRDLLEHLNQKRNHISKLLGIPLNNVKHLTSNLANSTADPFSCQVTFSNSQSIISCLTAKPITAEVSWSSLNKIYCHNLWLQFSPHVSAACVATKLRLFQSDDHFCITELQINMNFRFYFCREISAAAAVRDHLPVKPFRKLRCLSNWVFS